jgi:hypothetical protein
MPNTYTLIASSTVGAGGASSIDFTSIPSTYTDLVVKCSLRNSGTSQEFYVRFNGSTTSYSDKWLYGTGTAVASTTNTAIDLFSQGTNQSSGIFGSTEVYAPNYTSSNYKSVSSDSVQEGTSNPIYCSLEAGLWSNTAAINQVTLVPSGGTFIQYSTAYLYGIKNS